MMKLSRKSFSLVAPICMMIAPAFAVASEASLFSLAGVDAKSKKPCSLEVLEEGGGTEENPFLFVVKTSYSHGNDSPEAFQLKMASNRNDVLTGKAENGIDEIAVFITSGSAHIKTATSYNLRWQHGDHPHTNRCIELRLR